MEEFQCSPLIPVPEERKREKEREVKRESMERVPLEVRKEAKKVGGRKKRQERVASRR